jgi:hypothetical protein
MASSDEAARIQRLYREINDRIRTLSARAPEIDLVCECMRSACTERIRVTAREHERVRAHPRRFLVRAGHEALDVESVVERQEAYVVVEKLADASPAE